MREPWALEDEHPDVAQQREASQIERLKAVNEAYLEKIQELRFIQSRLAGEKAETDQRYHELLVTLSELTGAVTYSMEFIDTMETELWDLLGTDGLEELKEKVFIIERID